MTSTALQFRDANSYIYSPGANRISIVATSFAEFESPQVRFNGLDQRSYSDDLVDDGVITYTTAVSGWGFVQAGDGEEYALFSFTTAGVVTLIQNSANVANTDSDTDLCIYDGGTGIVIKNRLGAQKKIIYSIRDSA